MATDYRAEVINHGNFDGQYRIIFNASADVAYYPLVRYMRDQGFVPMRGVPHVFCCLSWDAEHVEDVLNGLNFVI